MALPVLALSLLAGKAAFAADGPERFETLLHQGFDLHQQANYAGALPLLRQALRLRPHDYFANLLVGIDLLRTGEPEQAIAYLKEASRQRPGEDFPYDYLGEAQAVLGRYADAAESHARALQAGPTSPEAMEGAVDFWVERFREMSAHLRSSDRGLAAEHRLQAMSWPATDANRRELLERAAHLDPQAPGIWSELAFADLAGGDAAAAQQHVERALEQDADDLHAMEVQALLAAHQGNWRSASAALNAIAQRSPGALAATAADWPHELVPGPDEHATGAAALFLGCMRRSCTPADLEHVLPQAKASAPAAADAIYRQQQWERLVSLPRPAAADAQGWFYRGVALARLDRCAQAVPALERSLKDTPDSVYAEFLLCWCYAKQAGVATERLQQAGADEAIAHTVRGDVLLRMQANSTAAMQEYKTALAAHPGDPKLLERLAEAQLGSGQSDAAAESARSALQLDPHRFSAMHTLARVAMEQRRYDEALPYLEQLAAREPNNAAAQVDLGTAFAETGNSAAALEHLGPALQHGYPDEKGSLHALLGAALRRTGRNEEAKQAFETARTLSEQYQSTAHRDPDDRK